MSSKIKKSLTISGAILLVITSAITAIFTPEVMLWVFVIVGADVAAMVLSWSATEYYKRIHVATKWTQDPVTDRIRPKLTIEQRNKVYQFAIRCGIAVTEAAGVVLLLLSMFLWDVINFADPRFWATMFVMFVCWQINSAIVGFSSPHVWVWTFDHLLPKINKRIDGE